MPNGCQESHLLPILSFLASQYHVIIFGNKDKKISALNMLFKFILKISCICVFRVLLVDIELHYLNIFDTPGTVLTDVCSYTQSSPLPSLFVLCLDVLLTS